MKGRWTVSSTFTRIGAASKTFSLRETTGPGGWYLIEVLYEGRKIDEVFYPSRKEAYEALGQRGYTIRDDQTN